MKRTTCPEKVFQSVLLAAVLISLSACGGGSGTADTALDSPLADQSVGTSTLGAGQGFPILACRSITTILPRLYKIKAAM